MNYRYCNPPITLSIRPNQSPRLNVVETIGIELTTSDGLRLEAEALRPINPLGAAVVCHPHPLHGGTMYDHVVGHLFRRFAELGLIALRFNFRGVGASEGEYGEGQLESLDVLAALDWLLDDTDDNDLRVALAGYSFGALVALGVEHDSLAGWLAIAPPLAMASNTDLVAAGDARPTSIVVGTNDQFCTDVQAAELITGWRTTTLTPIDGADHFLATAGAQLQAATGALVSAAFG